MPEATSDTPLIKANYIEITSPGEYHDLLVVECDPNRILYLREIVFEFDHDGMTDPKPMVNISINGKPYIKNHRVIGGAGGFGFGGHLKLWNHAKPLVIQIKTTVSGHSTFYATAYAIGIEVSKEE
jgi:hypothetical protein